MVSTNIEKVINFKVKTCLLVFSNLSGKTILTLTWLGWWRGFIHFECLESSSDSNEQCY